MGTRFQISRTTYVLYNTFNLDLEKNLNENAPPTCLKTRRVKHENMF